MRLQDEDALTTGCLVVVGGAILLIAAGFFFHIGWNLLDAM